MAFLTFLVLFYLPSSFFCIYFPPHLKEPLFLIFFIRFLCPSVPSLLLPNYLAMVAYSFLLLVIKDYVLISEDLELGTFNEREHVMYIFLGQDYLNQYALF